MSLEERAAELRRDFPGTKDVAAFHEWMVRWRAWLEDAADFFLVPQLVGA